MNRMRNKKIGNKLLHEHINSIMKSDEKERAYEILKEKTVRVTAIHNPKEVILLEKRVLIAFIQYIQQFL